MPPTEPSRTTRSGGPARRRPGCRHLATTMTIGATNRRPGGHSLPPPSRRPITASRPALPLRRNTTLGLDIVSIVGSSWPWRQRNPGFPCDSSAHDGR
jgi:hypothetical protein